MSVPPLPFSVLLVTSFSYFSTLRHFLLLRVESLFENTACFLVQTVRHLPQLCCPHLGPHFGQSSDAHKSAPPQPCARISQPPSSKACSVLCLCNTMQAFLTTHRFWPEVSSLCPFTLLNSILLQGQTMHEVFWLPWEHPHPLPLPLVSSTPLGI